VWTDPDWLAEAHAWIEAQGIEPTGPIEQPHIRPWSTVLRVPTAGGPVWFKAMVPVVAYETAVVEVVSAARPDLVPALLADDRERGWLLMGDGGERLRELIERERSFDRWLDALPRYAELQLDLAPEAERLVALGTPDRRLNVLAEQYAELATRPRGTDARVAEMCAQLASYGLPETIQHDDLHDGQVFVRDGRYLFFDWGDSCVSHPFFSLSVTLEGNISWGLDDVANSVDTAPFRDAYLEPFTRLTPRAELEAACAIALRLGWICRALNVDRFARGLASPDRERLLDEGVEVRLALAFQTE
jgi:hypothetical protein